VRAQSIRNKNAYLDGYWRTQQKGQVLVYRVTDARALALVVGTGTRAGKVKVFLGKKRIRTISLRGARAGQQIKMIKRFASPTSGRIKIVTTQKATIRIEGLGVSTLP
jgi:hypothetical protein